MTETFELRNKPELKFILKMDEFDLIDVSNPENNGSYSYEEIKRLELKKKRTNWLISLLSLVLDIFSGTGNGGKFKNKANLNLELKNRNLKVWLSDVEFKNAEKLTRTLFNKKI